MKKYPYSKELKKPLSISHINFEIPIVMTGTKCYYKYKNIKARLYKSKYNNVIRTITYNNDTYTSKCLVVEPSNTKDDLPVIVYYHGGAFIGGIQDLMVKNADYYAYKLNVRVFILDYHCLPKYKSNFIIEECYSLITYLKENKNSLKIDINKLIIYGESAGGTLSASIVEILRDKKDIMPILQMLIYPAIDNSLNYKSMEKYKYAVWSKKATYHMWRLYLKEKNKYAIPSECSDYSNYPSTYIEPAQIDTLCDEAVLYAEKLEASGIDVELNIIEGAYHSFDKDHHNKFVKGVLDYRISVMKKYLGR